MRIKRWMLWLWLAGAFGWGITAGRALGDEAANLSQLGPLPKPLLSWGISNFDSDWELQEWTRITRSCPVHLVFSSAERLAQCTHALSQNLGSILAVTYSPLNKEYNRLEKLYGDDRPQFRHERIKFILDLGARWETERDNVQARLREIHEATEGRIRVVVMYDHEYSVINELTVPVLCHKLNILGDMARGHGFEVLFYNYRSQREDATSPTGWSEFVQVPQCVRSDWASTSLYWPTETFHTREAMRRTLAAQSQDVVPFVSFGWSWRREYDAGKVSRKGRIDFPVVQTMMLADDLHKRWKARVARFYDNRRVPFVFTWPGVDHRVGGSTSFWSHFYAYHEGATE